MSDYMRKVFYVRKREENPDCSVTAGYVKAERRKQVLTLTIFLDTQDLPEECPVCAALEPCPMCAGAIVQARIPRVVIGSMNPKAGCAGSVLNLLQQDGLNHQVEITKGVLAEECSGLMTSFFRELRKKKKA